MRRKEGRSGLSESFVVGVIAIVFLLVGYQTALFIHRAAVMKIVANRDAPDTVFVYAQGEDASDTAPLVPIPISGQAKTEIRKNASHASRVEEIRQNAPPRRVESFIFDPNTVTVDQLCRLGFSPKQAQSIDNYRRKGGRFRRKEDFAKSFVVSDSIYSRLEPYIDIPLIDLNLADSAAFDALPGIGGWFASRMISHRKALGGYSYKEQLMDIYNFDEEKYRGLEDLVTVSSAHVTPYPLWTLPADSLWRHPYISNPEIARAIVLYRENTPPDQWSVEALGRAGILTDDIVHKFSRCSILHPDRK